MKNDKNIQIIKKVVQKRIRDWEETKDQGVTKAELAQLRRDVGKTFEEATNSWPIILQDIPYSMLVKNKNNDLEVLPVTPEVEAIFDALTLFALHYQGWNVNKKYNSAKPKFGQALYLFSKSDEDKEKRIQRRLKILLSQKNLNGAYKKIRPIIQILKSEGIELSYEDLVAEFYFCKYANGMNAVKYRWMADYYDAKNEEQHSKEKKK